MPVLRGSWNSQLTRWTEKVEDDCANVFIVRMFFIRESLHVQRRVSVSSVPSIKLGRLLLKETLIISTSRLSSFHQC